MNRDDKRKGNILVVDDKPDNLRLLVKLLSGQGYQVRPVLSGKLALSGAQAIPPDLILLDVMMPEMDGFETCRQLKASSKTKGIPIIFLTAKVSAEDIVAGFNLGAVDYITKPFNQMELLTRVKTHLTLKFNTESMLAESRKQKELLHVLCHDLVNQVSNNSVIWELMLENPTKVNDLKEYMSIGFKNILDIITLVREMSVLDEGKYKLELQNSNLKRLINRSHEILKHVFLKKNIDMEVDVDGQITVHVEETSMLNSVINNLLTNAVKFSFPNTKIAVTAKDEQDRVILTIRDFGIGIPKEIIGDLFDESKNTFRVGTAGELGTGYGLPLVKKFIDLYGGKIEVASWQKETDHGTEIRIELKKC